jgi:LCP family protein required for cell wall assembly
MTMGADTADQHGRHAAGVVTEEQVHVAGTDDGSGHDGDGHDGSGNDPTTDEEPRRPRVLRRVLISLGALALVLALVIGGGLWYLTERYAGNVSRLGDVFAGLDDRPAAPTPAQSEGAAPVTFLLIGSDTRADLKAGALPDARSDVIMLVRFGGDRTHAQVVSIPRDSWVDIPGHGMDKINASYAFGGPTLLIQTVEQLTGVRVDHFAALDFQGLIDITDALGGVDVKIAQTSHWGPYTFPAGTVHINGAMARWYLTERKDLPGGDFDRERRQQQYLKLMLDKLLSQGLFTDPGKLDSTMRTVTSNAADSRLSDSDLLGLATSLRGLRTNNIAFLTAPVLGTGREGSASVVYLDQTADKRMWSYLNTDSLGQNVGQFSKQQLPDVPN